MASREEKRYVYEVLMDKHEAKISLVGPRDRKIDILK
jgi:hypothetical protein